MAIVLVGGGARSGKSTYALSLARSRGTRLALIATAEARDDEMRARIEQHRNDRGPEFQTIEEPLDLARVLRQTAGALDAVVIDCLTLWLTNLMCAEIGEVESVTCAMLDAASANGALIIMVTNEVGCSIVPENDLARRFRDLAGRMNQAVAASAAEVYWMVFGCPLRVK